MAKPILQFTLSLWLFAALPAFPAEQLKNYALKDQSEKTIQVNDFKGNYTLVSFIYTRCPMPKMCPLTMSLNKQVFSLWKKNSPKTPLRFLIVTLDPSHDTPARMKEYGKSHGMIDASFTFATGSEQTINEFSSEFNALGFPSGGLISHNSKTALLSPELTILKTYPDNEWRPEEVWRDIKTLGEKTTKTP